MLIAIIVLLIIVMVALASLIFIVVDIRQNNKIVEELSLNELDTISTDLSSLLSGTLGLANSMEKMAKNFSDENGEESTKVPSIQVGAKFETVVDCCILGTFFFKDVRFAVICPFIADRYVAIPSVVVVDKDNTLKFDLGPDEDEDEIKKKSLEVFLEFKESHKDEFLGD